MLLEKLQCLSQFFPYQSAWVISEADLPRVDVAQKIWALQIKDRSTGWGTKLMEPKNYWLLIQLRNHRSDSAIYDYDWFERQILAWFECPSDTIQPGEHKKDKKDNLQLGAGLFSLVAWGLQDPKGEWLGFIKTIWGPVPLPVAHLTNWPSLRNSLVNIHSALRALRGKLH